MEEMTIEQIPVDQLVKKIQPAINSAIAKAFLKHLRAYEMFSNVPDLIQKNEMVKILGVPDKTLNRWEDEGKFIPFHRTTTRSGYYCKDDLIEWVSENKRKFKR